ncbi:MAG: tRNA pseudouridine(55) synthase TruB [Syntrophobacterales bacterium]|jgi:tRNA pseudouridine55 synthase|nr:tRNA pseudouridine(55) synthase TruB [Syntrophobacterales bacterium]
MTSGILLIDKPEGVTSFEVVRRARRALGIRKIGHLGTLDPFATGLLPLCVQEATKLVPYLMPEPKTYRAQVRLGVATDTQDCTGEVVATSEIRPTVEEIHRVAAGFVGEVTQVPPMHSAVHHEGERAYRLARRGEVVELAPRTVTIYELSVDAVAIPEFTMMVRCSQGTYIRTLAKDLGEALGCGAHLAALRRLAVGPLSVDEALPLARLTEQRREELEARIIPPAACLPGMTAVAVGPEEARRLRLGQAVAHPAMALADGQRVRVLRDGELVAVAKVRSLMPPAGLAPERVFVSS